MKMLPIIAKNGGRYLCYPVVFALLTQRPGILSWDMVRSTVIW